MDKAAILARKEAAFRMVCAVAQDGDRAWRMCVPPQPTDSDVCITASLEDIPHLVAALEAAETQIADLRGQLSGLSLEERGRLLRDQYDQ